MFHEPAQQGGPDPSAAYKTKIGMWMFSIYALIYTGFVILNLLDPSLMETIIFLGLNLAVVYGFFLIAFALVLALIYNHLCGSKEAELGGKK